MDVDGGGSVSYKEFVTAVLLPRRPESTAAQAEATIDTRRIFDYFDEDGSGEIDEDEMAAKLEGLGFDTDGVEQLFGEMAGPRKGKRAEERVIKHDAFAKYITLAAAA